MNSVQYLLMHCDSVSSVQTMQVMSLREIKLLLRKHFVYCVKTRAETEQTMANSGSHVEVMRVVKEV